MALTTGQIKKFNYTGSVQSIELSPGTYKLECYGASGGVGYGKHIDNPYGNGGYISGVLTLSKSTILYVYVGQDGVDYSSTTTKFNGGGAAYPKSGHNGGAGGGGTDFRLKSGEWNNTESLKSRILVAGGGGGGKSTCGGSNTTPGHGGNFTGAQSYAIGGGSYAGSYSNGGTQTSGGTSYNNHGNKGNYGSFGAGGDAVECGAGGGGGWYGGGSGYTSGGGGGSSYAAGWSGCDTTYRKEQNYTTLTDVTYSQGVNVGNGYAIITCIKAGYLINAIANTGINKIVNKNGDIQDSAQEGETVTLIASLKPGYKDVYWIGDFNSSTDTITFVMPNNEVTITAQCIPRDDTLYKVNHFTVNLDKSHELKESTEHQGTTGSIVTPPINVYTGFVSPELISDTINGDGSTVINYYYNRDTFTLTVLNGTSDKYEYLFEEEGNLIYDRMDDATYTFDYWNSEQKVDISNIAYRQTTFKMPPYNVTIFVIGKLNRLNTNIYKNIFPDYVINMDYINSSLEDLPETSDDIRQNQHGLNVGNVIYLDSDGLYKKALAEDSKRAFPVGVVSKVSGDNFFTITKSGKMSSLIRYNYNDTSILYLSDTTPGKLVHYEEIKNDIYIPVAVYTNQGIIVNIQEGSKGSKMFSYGTIIQDDTFESYTNDELNEVINIIKEGVK